MKTKHYTLITLMAALSLSASAQTTPNMYKMGGTTTTKVFLSYINYHVQSLYAPGTFTSLQSGYINKIYFRAGENGSCIFNSLTIKMAQTSQPDFGSATPITFLPASSFTQVFSGSVNWTYSIGSWVEIPLSTPFYYDSSLSLVIDHLQGGSTGMYNFMFFAQSIPTGPYSIIYNYTDTVVNAFGYRLLPDIGFSITPMAAGINDVSKFQLRPYPNPTKAELYVNSNRDFTYSICDMQGKTLQTGSNKAGEPVPTTNLATGMYLLQVSDEQNRYVTRFSKTD